MVPEQSHREKGYHSVWSIMIEFSVFVLNPSPEHWKFGPAFAETEGGPDSISAKAWTLWLLFIGLQLTFYSTE